MTSANPHRILRQVLELELASARGALELQEEAARPFREPPLPELEELFDRFAGPGEVLRIERLELDLGELVGEDWQAAFRDRLLLRIGQALEAAAAEAPRKPSLPPPQAALEDASETRFRQLLFFLAHGRLPWWGGRPRQAWADAVPEELGAAEWRTLGELLGRDPRARQRLIYTVGDGFLDAFARTLGGFEEAPRVLALTAPPDLSPGGMRRWRRRFWATVVAFAAAGPADADRGRRLMRRLLDERTVFAAESSGTAAGARRRIEARPDATTGEGARPSRRRTAAPLQEAAIRRRRSAPGGDIAAEPPLPPLPRPWQDWLEAAIARALAEGGAREKTRQRPSNEVTAKRPEGDGPAAPSSDPGNRAAAAPLAEPSLPAAGEHSQPAPATLAADEAIYLEGAGAVLLHPFVEELFESRELLRQRAFLDRAAQRRAVHLVGWLTFGSDEVPEYDLLLAKLLCDLPAEEPLPPIELDDAERTACGELLAAVLKHWQALRSASPDWLRQQFFLRPGKLEPVDGGLKLTVERRAQDVLLDKLPWGLGLVRLPWMRHFLHVSWTA